MLQRFLSPKGKLKVAGLLGTQYVKIKSKKRHFSGSDQQICLHANSYETLLDVITIDNITPHLACVQLYYWHWSKENASCQMTWCWKRVNPLADHVSVRDPPHGCASTKPFLCPIIRQNFTLNLWIMWRTHRAKGAFLFLNSYAHMKENNTCSHTFSQQAPPLPQAAFWPTSKATLNDTCRHQKTNCRFKETIIYGFQPSTTFIQINFQTWAWLWGAPLPVSLTQWGVGTNNCQMEGLKTQGWRGRCEMFYITANVQ